jgi:hypothetical protein
MVNFLIHDCKSILKRYPKLKAETKIKSLMPKNRNNIKDLIATAPLTNIPKALA